MSEKEQIMCEYCNVLCEYKLVDVKFEGNMYPCQVHRCPKCGKDLTEPEDMLEFARVVERKEMEDVEKISVRKRTEEQHRRLIKKYGGIRNYLLSIGKFIEVEAQK